MKVGLRASERRFALYFAAAVVALYLVGRAGLAQLEPRAEVR